MTLAIAMVAELLKRGRLAKESELDAFLDGVEWGVRWASEVAGIPTEEPVSPPRRRKR